MNFQPFRKDAFLLPGPFSPSNSKLGENGRMWPLGTGFSGTVELMVGLDD